MNLWLKITGAVVLAILTLGIGIGYKQVTYRQEFAITNPQGIQVFEPIPLGGLEQWISIRGEDRSKPVLLILHGGPGFPLTPAIRHHNRGLEEHFVVVNWDQRGAGKSYSPDIPPEAMTFEHFISDIKELAEILKDRFDEEKIYLAGISWGSMIGTVAAYRYPELFHAYIGIGQAVHFIEAEKISYQFALDQAREMGNQKAIKELEAIGPPPYTGPDYRTPLAIQRNWLFRFGGEAYGQTSNLRHVLGLLGLYAISPEYSLGDVFRLLDGNKWSNTLLWETLLSIDLYEQAPGFDLPIFFIQGRHDYVTVWELVEDYYQKLEAPKKQLIWFDESAHGPMFEEPEKFVQTMAEILEATYPAF